MNYPPILLHQLSDLIKEGKSKEDIYAHFQKGGMYESEIDMLFVHYGLDICWKRPRGGKDSKAIVKQLYDAD